MELENRIRAIKERMNKYNQYALTHRNHLPQIVDREIESWERFLLPASNLFSSWGNQHPCHICGNYGYGLDRKTTEPLCIEHWLDAKEEEMNDENHS